MVHLDANESPVPLEIALNQVGVGTFQLLVLLTCGLANAADAVEILSVGLLGTAAEDELDLTPDRVGILNACIFLGMFLGGLLWGVLGDAIGRRASLVFALFVNAAFGAMSAGSQTLEQLVVLRMIAGLGVGGSVPIVFTTMSEFSNAHSRGKFMAGVASFWMVGSVFSAFLGWSLITTQGWRTFVLVASTPAWIVVLLAVFFLPETPRHLLVKGQVHKANQVMHRMAAMNGRQLPANFSLKPVRDVEEEQRLAKHHAALSFWGRTCHQVSHTWSVMGSLLLKKPLRAFTWPLMAGWIGLCGGWYCTVLWLPKYFELRGATGGSIYRDTLCVALANLPGNLASLYLVDKLGRRLTSCVCMAGACVCALLFAAAPAEGMWPTVAAMVFNGVSVGGWNALDAISAELYPTSVRSTGFGLLGAVGRVSSFLTTYAAGGLLQVRLWAPLVLAAVLLAIGGVAMMMLPEPAGKPLQDVADAHGGGHDISSHKIGEEETALLLDTGSSSGDLMPEPTTRDGAAV